MTKTVLHLVGSGPGPGGIAAARRHFKTAIAALGPPSRKKPLVAYVGVANGDNATFRKMFCSLLKGVDIVPAYLVRKTSKTSAARTVLDDCDMVFLAGGDVHAGMQILRERGIDDDMRRLAAGGKYMLGVSAGSLMLAKEWVHFPDDKGEDAELFDCLGIAPIHVDAHSEEDGWVELRALLRKCHERGDRLPTALGLPTRGALRVDLGGKKPQLSALGVPLPRLTVRRGKVVDATPLAPA